MIIKTSNAQNSNTPAKVKSPFKNKSPKKYLSPVRSNKKKTGKKDSPMKKIGGKEDPELSILKGKKFADGLMVINNNKQLSNSNSSIGNIEDAQVMNEYDQGPETGM